MTPHSSGNSSPALRLAASLWSADPARLDEEIRRLLLGGIDLVHWDVSDGDFARPGGVDLETSRRLAADHSVRSEAHLMVRRPIEVVDAWAGHCERLVVHAESEDWLDAVERILSLGREPAVALAPGTPDPESPRWPRLVMAIRPGDAGATFSPAALESVRNHSSRSEVGVDGGVDADTGKACLAAGATWLVSGTALLAASDPRAWVARLLATSAYSTGGQRDGTDG